jgi:hypothetical protein
MSRSPLLNMTAGHDPRVDGEPALWRPAWPGAGAARKGPWAGLSALNGGQAQACNGTEGDQRQAGMCLKRRAWEMHAETNHPPGRKAPAGRGPASTAWATFSAVKRRP